VFVRVVYGSTDLARARISDGAIRAVATTPDRPERWPYWSDAAQRLLFQVGDAEDRDASDLVLWDPKTEVETPLVTTPHRAERWPEWSPDGRWIAYAFFGGDPVSGIATVDWRSGKVALIARSGSRDLYLRPNFSPDGGRLVAQRRIDGPGTSQLWVVAAGGTPKPLTRDPKWVDIKPWFTRGGKRIVYSRRAGDDAPHDVVSIRAHGGDLRPIAATAADEHSARPSPTRDEVALVSNRDGSSDLFLVNLSGTDLRNLRRTPEWNDFAPRWSPDGERIVVTAVPKDLADFGTMTPAVLAHARVIVLDREGKVLLETPGAMADWMPPWP
jgi:Tol biopolymer transport system component